MTTTFRANYFHDELRLTTSMAQYWSGKLHYVVEKVNNNNHGTTRMKVL
jgi:hypothetical protein